VFGRADPLAVGDGQVHPRHSFLLGAAEVVGDRAPGPGQRLDEPARHRLPRFPRHRATVAGP